jgi:hypothetical protein
MSVTVDDEPLAADSLGLATVGEVLAHLRARNRLVVHVLIDGHEPDLGRLEMLREQQLGGHAVFIETIEPHRIAGEVFDQVESLLTDADELRTQAVDHLQAGEHADALKKLGICFTTWNHTQESIEKVARLLKIDLDRIVLNQGTLQAFLTTFTTQLGDIRTALESRDYSHLGDILAYEAHDAGDKWRQAIGAMRATLR